MWCKLRISGDRSGEHQSRLSLTVRQTRKTCSKHLMHLVLINLPFRGKDECLGRRLLWPVLFLEVVYQTGEAFTLTAGASPSRAKQRGKEVSSGGKPLGSVFFMFGQLLLNDTLWRAFNWNWEFGHAVNTLSASLELLCDLCCHGGLACSPPASPSNRPPAEGQRRFPPRLQRCNGAKSLVQHLQQFKEEWCFYVELLLWSFQEEGPLC